MYWVYRPPASTQNAKRLSPPLLATPAAGGTLKTTVGLATAGVKTFIGLAKASTKTVLGLTP